jgi:hypothetical protein
MYTVTDNGDGTFTHSVTGADLVPPSPLVVALKSATKAYGELRTAFKRLKSAARLYRRPSRGQRRHARRVKAQQRRAGR